MNLAPQSSFAKRTAPYDPAERLFPAFYDAAHEVMEAAYPLEWCKFGHHLARHPLLARDALVRLAALLPSDSIEAGAGLEGLDTAGMLQKIADAKSWMCLRHLERDPRYDMLMRDVLTEVKPFIKGETGAMMRPEARVLIASAHSEIDVKTDMAYTIAFQLSGSRRVMSTGEVQSSPCPAAAQAPSNEAAPERMLRRYALAPGEAVYIPAFASQAACVDEEMSVSLALTWHSRWSIQCADAHMLNERLHQRGVNPEPVRAYPRSNRAKSYAWRLLQRWDRLKDVFSSS